MLLVRDQLLLLGFSRWGYGWSEAHRLVETGIHHIRWHDFLHVDKLDFGVFQRVEGVVLGFFHQP